MSDTLHLDDQTVDAQPIRIQVELMSSAEVKRLEGRDDDLREELKQLRSEYVALRRSFYELLEVFGDIKHSRSQTKK